MSTVYVIVSIDSDGLVEMFEIPKEGALELQQFAKARSADEATMPFPCVLDESIKTIMERCYFFEMHKYLVYCLIVRMLQWSTAYKNVFFPSNLFFHYLGKYTNKKICSRCKCSICPLSPEYHPYALPEEVPEQI